eukprot:CAMPEP_0116883910 /NCGR_PEP_ID=MMETSP0463-20121206/16585_1 /TAXON_ID=181622 /ORGANISM="Strombidinopsis sp, Strain SopsisLIS2011" /LENGTH=195 /DNA_ID=CAMNT_0004539453 /DNA_START=2065 /DNA_END=2652 /DNA_ORIENTATION=-
MFDCASKQAKKCFFIDSSGLQACSALSSSDSFAIASLNHNVHIFSFYTGTVIASFPAHNDTINKILFKDDMLFTFSSDQEIKVWNLKTSNFNDPIILQDHNEEVLAACVHETENLMASIDADGAVFVKDTKALEDEPLLSLYHNEGYDSGALLFNRHAPDELFVGINNMLYMYKVEGDGQPVQQICLDENIQCIK